MGQGTIKKGFFFYFGLFALVLIAVFMCCLVIMMFNPGKTVLWMQYFTGNQEIEVSKTNDGTNQAINLGDLTGLEIKCSYANVTIKRSKDITKDTIIIKNNAKGFAAAKYAEKFHYDAHFEDSKLVIEIVEPVGFLYLSKDIEIIVNSYVESGRNIDFSILNLSAETTKGNINIGGGLKAADNVKLLGLTAKTESGDINLNSKFDMSALSKLNLGTTKGKISSTAKADGEVLGIKTNCDINIENTQGKVNLGAIVSEYHTLNMTCIKGDIAVDTLKVRDVKIKCAQGNYRFKNVYANLSFDPSSDSLLSPNIMSDYIQGDFTLAGNNAAKPDVIIKKIDGKVSVSSGHGSINIHEAKGDVDATSLEDLSVNLIIGENAGRHIRIVTKNGSIKLSFMKKATGSYELKTQNSVVINYTNQALFTANAYKYDTEEEIGDSNIILNWGATDGISKNPYSTGTGGLINIHTNKKVYYNLKTLEDITGNEVV